MKAKVQAPTLGEFAKDFLGGYVKANNKASEAHTKRLLLRIHLLPAFGTRRLTDISVRDIERYKAAKLAGGYQPKTINNQLAVTVLRCYPTVRNDSNEL